MVLVRTSKYASWHGNRKRGVLCSSSIPPPTFCQFQGHDGGDFVSCFRYEIEMRMQVMCLRRLSKKRPTGPWYLPTLQWSQNPVLGTSFIWGHKCISCHWYFTNGQIETLKHDSLLSISQRDLCYSYLSLHLHLKFNNSAKLNVFQFLKATVPHLKSKLLFLPDYSPT